MNQQTGSNAFVILDTLARSKQYIVYLAKNYFSNQKVVIKTIDPQFPDQYSLKQALQFEAETGLKLNHPRIRASYNSFEEDSKLYYVCEFVDGVSLDEYMSRQQGRVELSRGLNLCKQLLEALDYAHSNHLLHLNLNPSNILISNEGELKLFGFGKAQLTWMNADPDTKGQHPACFLSPEQYKAEICTPASDIYSFGVLSYLMLCGFLPWNTNKAFSPREQKEQSFARPVQDPEMQGVRLPQWLFSILNKCLMLDPRLRFHSAGDVLDAILEERLLSYRSVLTKAPLEVLVDETEPIAENQTENEPDAVPELSVVPEPHVIAEPVFHSLGDEEADYISEPVSEPVHEPVFEPVYEPDPIPEPIVPPIPDPVPEPVHIPEPVFEPEPVPEPRPHPLQEPKPHVYQPPEPASQPWSAAPRRSGDEDFDAYDARQTSSLGKTRRLFTILFLLSLMIVCWIILKNGLLKPEPKFKSLSETDNAEVRAESKNRRKNFRIPMQMIAADTLTIGSIDPAADSDEFPLMNINIPAFMISPTEITQEQWQMVFENNPSVIRGNDLPVTNITFYEAIDWCIEKSYLDGLKPCYEYFENDVVCDFSQDGYRLPTEAEWEFAAKGRRNRYELYAGSDEPDGVGWYIRNSDAAPHKVGQKASNLYGLYDMSGNVYEWVWNWYAPYSHRIPDPFAGSERGTDRVLRGGSWFHPASEMRVTNRFYAKPYTAANYIGFRVVRRSVN